MVKAHEFWATISGSTLDDILQQQHSVWDWGVSTVEIRTDLVPRSLHEQVLNTVVQAPTWVAHFGTGAEAGTARTALHEALAADTIDGIVCHSRLEGVQEMAAAAQSAGKGFVAAFHSQTPVTLDEALDEYEYQGTLNPLFRKIAARAHTVEEALTLLQATHRASKRGGIPVVGAVFGPQRWARIAMPAVGSTVTFVIAHPVPNEAGGDDEQLTIEEATAVCSVRRIVEPPRARKVLVEAGNW
jgi:3-dehydroquinate dehydratase